MIPEPTSALNLWPQVRAISGWPQTNELEVETLAKSLTDAARALERPAGLSTGPGDASWPDDAGREYAASTRSVLTKAAETATATDQLATAASSFASLVAGTKTSLTGLINLNLPLYASLSLLPAAVRGPAEAFFVSQVGLFAKGVMTAAATQAGTLGQVQTALTPGGDANRTPLPPPPPNGTAQQNADWWKSLTPDQQQQYLREQPGRIGNLNGLPSEVRDQANRSVLNANRAATQAERDRLQAELNRVGSAPGRAAERSRLQNQLAAVEDRLQGLNNLQQTLDSVKPGTFDTMGRELDRYYLLGFDPTGNGRFIVAHGNPDRTPNIATFVPGAASGLNESGRALERGDNLYDAATRAGAEPGSTAVITWLGYDSPGLGEAFGSYAPAQAAAPALTQFQQGLTVARGGLDANTTLVGHSYGARVIGTAASATPGLADQVVAAGALDFGVNPSGRMIQSTAELHLPQDKVWVVEHRLDAAADATTPVVPDAGGYGVVEDVGAPGGDPSRPEFGASVVGAEPGPYRDSYVGLGGYATEPFSDAHGNMFDPDPGHRAGLDRMGGVIVNGRAE